MSDCGTRLSAPHVQHTVSLTHLLTTVHVERGQGVGQPQSDGQQAPVAPHGLRGVEEVGEDPARVEGEV